VVYLAEFISYNSSFQNCQNLCSKCDPTYTDTCV